MPRLRQCSANALRYPTGRSMTPPEPTPNGMYVEKKDGEPIAFYDVIVSETQDRVEIRFHDVKMVPVAFLGMPLGLLQEFAEGLGMIATSYPDRDA